MIQGNVSGEVFMCCWSILLLYQAYPPATNYLACVHLLFGHRLTGLRYCLQPGTKEDSCKVVKMKEIDGLTLRRLVSIMYGQSPALGSAMPGSKQADAVMQLFEAADPHQIIESVAALL